MLVLDLWIAFSDKYLFTSISSRTKWNSECLTNVFMSPLPAAIFSFVLCLSALCQVGCTFLLAFLMFAQFFEDDKTEEGPFMEEF